MVAALLRFIPKIGPFKGLGFKSPTPQTEDLYIKSINTTVDQYRTLLEEVRARKLLLPNCDFDTGNPTKLDEYSLADDTYDKLLGQLAKNKFEQTTQQLRDNILQFYAEAPATAQTRDSKVPSANVAAWLAQLKAATPVPAAESVATR